MPSLTITVTAAQWARIQAALHFETGADAEAWVKAQIKEAVRAAETDVAASAKDAEVRAEDW